MGKILNRLAASDGASVSGNIGGIVVNGIPVEIREGKGFIKLGVVCSMEFYRSIKDDMEADCRSKNINPPYYEGTEVFFGINDGGAFDIIYGKIKEVIATHLTEIKDARCPVCNQQFCDCAAFQGPYFVPTHRKCLQEDKKTKATLPDIVHVLIGVLITIAILFVNLLMILGMQREMSIIYLAAGIFGALYVKSKCPGIKTGLKFLYAGIASIAQIFFPYICIGILLCNYRGMAFSEIFSRWPVVLSYTFTTDNVFMLLCIAVGIIFTWGGIFGKDNLSNGNAKKVVLPL